MEEILALRHELAQLLGFETTRLNHWLPNGRKPAAGA
ncbi:Uncharacterised protein [Escherichia coli]|nr:Uncharacterised protein [Escherichia coli]